MKTCKCGETDLSKFYKNKSRKDGIGSMCKSCSKKYTIEYVHKNRTKISKYKKEWKLNNSEKVKAQEKKWVSNNPEKVIKKSKKYYLKHKDKVNEYKTKNKEKIKKYTKEHSTSLNNSTLDQSTNHYQAWTCHDFEIAVRKRASGSYIFTAVQAALRLKRTYFSIRKVRFLNSQGFIPSDFTGKRSEYFNP